MARRRVAVTGLGAVTSLGPDLDHLWHGARAGRTVVAAIPPAWREHSPLRSGLYAPLGDWERATPLLSRIERRQLDPVSRLAVLVAEEGLAGAGLELEPVDAKRNTHRLRGLPAERCGVFLGTGVGGIHTSLASTSFVLLDGAKKRLAGLAARLGGAGETSAADELEAILATLPSPRAFNPFSVAMTMPNAAASNLSIKLGLNGPSRTFCCACASGTVAVGRATGSIAAGECDLALAGGVEFLTDPYGCTFRGFDAIGALVRGELPPEASSRPFDRQRSGFLFSEGGAGLLVLEALETARQRGAEVLAEVVGYGETSDAHHIMALAPDGRQIRRALELCLDDAGLEPGAIDHINPHGTATPTNDPVEAEVLEALFGHRPAVATTKSLLGHTLGASGAIEAVLSVLTLHHGRSHPCRNLDEPIADLAFVTSDAPLEVEVALSQSFAFGGQNAVIALARRA